MPILPYKKVKVTEGLRVKVSNHFFYTDFGVRDSGEMRYYGRRYVPSNTPGTGFVERESESHSYHNFVRACLDKEKPNDYLRMLLGKEPSFAREMARVSEALKGCDDEQKRPILECYYNALTTGRAEERLERIVRGIKDKIGHKSNKFLVSVLSHYKTKISHLESEMRSVEYNIREHCSEETFKAYGEMTDAFTKMAACRRIWHYDEAAKNKYVQVYFDMGIFDFIRSEYYLPVIRDSRGVHYYILPDSIIVARSSVDFDIVSIKDMTIVCQELSIEEPVDVLSTQLGDAASMIKIPDLDLTFYFNHVRAIVDFIKKMDALKATL
jgi:hypothetical protein